MDEQTFALRDVLHILRHHRWQILSMVAAVVSCALVISFSEPPRYTAQAQFVLRPTVPDAALPEAPTSNEAGPLGLDLPAETQSRILASPIMATRVARRLGLSPNPAQIQELTKRVEAKAVTDNLLLITANAPSSRLAAALANGYAKAFLDYRRETASNALQALATDYRGRAQDAQRNAERLDQQIKAASARGASGDVARLTSDRSDLLDQVRDFDRRAQRAALSRVSDYPSGEIIAPATLQGQSRSPNPYRNVLIAIILGGAAGVSIALFREHVNDRVRTRDAAARAANAPVLAALPKHRPNSAARSRLVAIDAPESMASEAYRQLRRNLVRRGLGTQIRRLLVTSVEGGRETSETVANLAALCARAGQTTMAVSADLRGSGLHTYFGISTDRPGLASVLAEGEGGERSVETALSALSMVVSVAEINLLVLPSGIGSVSPGELFTSAPLEHIFNMAGEMAEVLIIEAPPVLGSDDAIALTAHADATLLVVRAGVDKEALTARAAATLETAGSVLLGVVLHQVQKDDETVGSFEGRRFDRDHSSASGLSDGRWGSLHIDNGRVPGKAPNPDSDREEPTHLPIGEQRPDGN
jgi:capsular exopolysaccharide synthesis family protein